MALGTGAVKDLMTVAVVAAMFHLVTHAFFKALLFLSAGNVMHAMGDVIDMREFSGLKKVLPKTNILFAIGAAALAGVPLLSGFFSKDGVLGVLVEAGNDTMVGGHFTVLLGIGFITALLTATYTAKAYFKTFHGVEKIPAAAGHHAHEASGVMLAPMAVLAVGALVIGGLLGPTGRISEYVSLTPWLHHHEHHEPMWLLATSSLIAIAGVFLGYGLSRREPSSDGLLKLVADFGRNRLYIDWLYERMVVEPMLWVGRLLTWFDATVIGSLTEMIAGLPRVLGLAGQRIQTGRIPAYSFLTAVGIAAVAIWIVTRANW
jgi:NADH-quinone oxidoreductase subunit L